MCYIISGDNMEKIVFVTSNEGKVKTAQKYFSDIELEYFKYELIEPRSESLEEIAEYKVTQAYEIVKSPCIALDSGFYIESLDNWPGTFVNYNLKKLVLKGMMKLLKNETNRNASFKECLAYYDGFNIKFFYGETKGTVSKRISSKDAVGQWSILWRIFVPINHHKTMAAMSKKERDNRKDNHTDAFKEFSQWIKDKK